MNESPKSLNDLIFYAHFEVWRHENRRANSLRRALTGAALVIASQWAIIIWLAITRKTVQANLTPMLMAASFIGVSAGLLIAAGITLLTRSR